jgi:16S rRNA (cytosine1402-N4)-methyltransferase
MTIALPSIAYRQARRSLVADLPIHVPVMLDEVLALLLLRPGSVVVDGTVGLAGHAMEFAKRIAPGGTLVGFDWDQKMLDRARARLSEVNSVRLVLVNADYRTIAYELRSLELQADGILLDLGLNSAQIEDSERGISFQTDGPLDMRMSQDTGEPASALLNRASVDEIEDILFNLGDEKWARAIARQIVARRKDKPLRTAQDLVDCVMAAVPPGARDKRIHPATRTFQGVRIAINRELDHLDEAIASAASALAPGGVLVVLSYHSGEDRAAKVAIRSLDPAGFEEITRKPQLPSAEEVRRNPRSRSVKLRAVRRLPKE